MRTTLILPDTLMVALKRHAAERGTSLSALATELLQQGLDERPRADPEYVPNFLVFDMGRPLLGMSDWSAFREALDAGDDAERHPGTFEGPTATPSRTRP